MSDRLYPNFRRFLFSFSTLIVVCGGPEIVEAHVQLDSPNGGEALMANSIFTIEWHPTIAHDTLNWDLWYSTQSAQGPWLDIALDLPPGDISTGSKHTFDWLVPNVIAQHAWIRVQQDNMGQDYSDVNNNSFAIIAAATTPGDYNADGVVDAADYTVWREHLGESFTLPNESATPGTVTVEDYGIWKSQFGVANASATYAEITQVPEQSGIWLLCIAIPLIALHYRWLAGRRRALRQCGS